ncbi:MAG TPA: hypothetical protein VNK04_03975 [Gemmataceae bacterium]|nr:hypothetical protein [Gemmataceae bacterium]
MRDIEAACQRIRQALAHVPPAEHLTAYRLLVRLADATALMEQLADDFERVWNA